ncbi:MAG: FkbM family methyltransferase [Deltaproteobacteria bacterium HGW-Deltaproteobacteria-19]|nr:MAG: FkbM family methyltransferase [Deltaproteobacteria bacterium HGW-Deltaproteobacteria-19]
MNVNVSQYLMGIGSASHVKTSGERCLMREVLRRAKPEKGLCIFDVGANRGQFIEMIERGLDGLPHHVHAFEPSEHAFRQLADAVRDNPNVTANAFGLGCKKGIFNLYTDAPGSGLASLSQRRLDHFGINHSLKESVRIETLDEYCGQKGVQAIDLLKIDVEGHEIDVLRGGSRMIRSGNIGIISFEFGGSNIDTKTYFQDFYYFFHDCGMNRIFRLTPFGRLVEIRDYREIDEQFRTTNFVVMKEDA